ncbi:MAG TPA: bifunctional metallophosphatase/5'-nucleotidase [Cyclobacteriaceae bacterium]|nr:bifunctional metallophosphatase/5'-nucleotidase [Cyclobacteriaceae bacterium]
MKRSNDTSCDCHQHLTNEVSGEGRRDFLKKASALTIGAISSPLVASSALGDEKDYKSLVKSNVVKSGKAEIVTILHTADIHSQLYPHDEFFVHNGQVVYKKRGGLAVLKTMLHSIRSKNRGNTLLIDGGDCFQGGGLAALTNGRALVPIMNNIGYDLVLPGNWEVAYGKENMIKDLGAYHASKICANMFHDSQDSFNNDLIFEPYWTKFIGGIKIGFIGYTDHAVPKRQPPAFSKGIRYTKPVEDVAKYVKILKEYEQCEMIFLVTHLGLAQQVHFANQPALQGVDHILGADTHERVRQPIQGKYATVSEPGAFGSFVSKFDMVVENGKVKDKIYQLLDVDPERYKPDAEIAAIIEKERAPYRETLETEIGKSKIPLVRYYVMETPMDNLVTDALMWKFKPDIAISNGFRFCPPLVPDRKTGLAVITMDYLWSMVPVNGEIKWGDVPGKQLWDWLEQELNNVFAKNPAERFGGWVVRMKGMKLNFTMKNDLGSRINWVTVNNEPINLERFYKVCTCEREGDPDNVLCRLGNVQKPTLLGSDMHQTLIEYLKVHSPVSPIVEGRVTATDAPPTLLSQLEGFGYEFF